MHPIFPSQEWLDGFENHLNSDEKYAQIAKNWEGSVLFDVQPSGALEKRLYLFLDLWHGKCRGSQMSDSGDPPEADFVLQASYDRFVEVLLGKLHPMQAMLTRKLILKGSMTYMMRNVPTVLEFVRCAQDVTDSYVGQE